MIRNLKSKIENLKYKGSAERAGTGGQGNWMKTVNRKIICSISSAWLFVLYALLPASSFAAETQRLAKIPRIGFLGAGSSSSYSTGTETLRQGLRDLGY